MATLLLLISFGSPSRSRRCDVAQRDALTHLIGGPGRDGTITEDVTETVEVNFTVSREHAEWLRWLTSWSLLAGVLGRAAEDVAVLAPILGADAVAHTETIRTTVVRHEAL